MIPYSYRSIESPIPSSGRNKKLVDVRIPGRPSETELNQKWKRVFSADIERDNGNSQQPFLT